MLAEFLYKVRMYILLVVEEVVRHVVARVSKDATAVGSQSTMPVPEDDKVSKLPEWRCKNDKERGWHDEAILVHGEVVVDTVKKEVEGNTDTVVWEVAAWC